MASTFHLIHLIFEAFNITPFQICGSHGHHVLNNKSKLDSISSQDYLIT
jgi:hypothetical protein